MERCDAKAPDGTERCDQPRGHEGRHEGPAIRGRHRWPEPLLDALDVETARLEAGGVLPPDNADPF